MSLCTISWLWMCLSPSKICLVISATVLSASLFYGVKATTSIKSFRSPPPTYSVIMKVRPYSSIT